MQRPTPHPHTIVVASGRPDGDGASLNHPITTASNFRTGGDLWYARSDGTPTIHGLERLIGDLEGGEAVAFSSGMAAAAAVVSLVPEAGAVARSSDAYHGVGQLLEEGQARGRWAVRQIAAGDLPGWSDALSEADLVWIETPTNPLLEITDLPRVCSAGRSAIVAVDSTFATPLGQQPLDLGADLVVHSATKFIGGHSDLVAGVVVGRDRALLDRIRAHRTIHGSLPGALESFLAARGARTLGVRMAQAAQNAEQLAARLSEHPAVRRVRYPGLLSHPGHEIASTFMQGGGAVVSFELGDAAAADRFLEHLALVVHATSLGGIETTAERRSGYEGSDNVPAGLVRMSVGCEHVDDLWADIEAALDAIGA